MQGNQSRTFNTDDGEFELRGLQGGSYTVHATTSEGLIAVQAQAVEVVDDVEDDVKATKEETTEETTVTTEETTATKEATTATEETATEEEAKSEL